MTTPQLLRRICRDEHIPELALSVTYRGPLALLLYVSREGAAEEHRVLELIQAKLEESAPGRYEFTWTPSGDGEVLEVYSR